MFKLFKDALSPSPRPQGDKTRQQTLDTVFSRMNARNMAKVASTPPSLTTDSSATDRSSEPVDETTTPEEQTSPTKPFTNTIKSAKDAMPSMLSPHQKNFGAGSRTVSGETLGEDSSRSGKELLKESMDRLDPAWDLGELPGDNLNSAPEEEPQNDTSPSKGLNVLGRASSVIEKTKSVLGKRKQPTMGTAAGKTEIQTRRKSSSPEHIPSTEEPVKKRPRFSVSQKHKEGSPRPTPVRKSMNKGSKQWLNHGLYVGQDFSEGKGKPKTKSESTKPEKKVNSIMPRPMFAAGKLLEEQHARLDFKLPFDVFSPLPPGQPKPDEWKKTGKSEDGLFHLCSLD